MKGFIALTSVLIIGAVLLIIALSAATRSIYAEFDTLERTYKAESESLGEGCAGVVLLRLIENPSYAGDETIRVQGTDCIVSAIQKNAPQESVTVSVTYNRAVTNRMMVVDSSTMTLIQNTEIPNLP